MTEGYLFAQVLNFLGLRSGLETSILFFSYHIMNSTSSLYNSIFSGIHRFEVKVNIGSTDYSMNVLTSLNSCRSVFGSGSPRLGLAPAGELSLSLYLNSASVPRMAEIRP